MQERNTFKKEERLSNKVVMDSLFKTGSSAFVFPFKFLYKAAEHEQEYPVKVVFSVPKRSFKQAVLRNQLRRRMREAYRLNKTDFYKQLESANHNIVLMIIYVDKQLAPYAKIEKAMVKGMKRIVKDLKN